MHMLAEEHGNYCLEYAENIKGAEYIAIFHGDDIYNKEIISNQVEFLDRNKDAPMVFTDGLIVDEDYATIGWVKSKKKSKNISKYTLEEILYGMVSSTITCLCPTVMIRAKILLRNKKYRFNPNLFGKASDYGLWLEIIGDYDCVGIIHENLIQYRKSTTSDSVQVHYSIEESPLFKNIAFYIGNKGEYRYKGWRWGAHIERLGVQDYMRRLNNELSNNISGGNLLIPEASLKLIIVSLSSLSGMFNLINLLALKIIYFITPPGNMQIAMLKLVINNDGLIIITRKCRIFFKIDN